ncbi:MAG: permease [Cyanobacteria bacterium P01_F01_bin.53]
MYNQFPNRKVSLCLGICLSLWVVLVSIAAQSGFLSRLELSVTALIVVSTIVLPTLLYFRSSALQAWFRYVGQRRIVAFHMWRIPAALLFFYFGFRGELPGVFWILAGVGDFIAGAHAMFMTAKKHRTPKDYRRFHFVGFADFVVAVGTGVTYTLLLQDPRMVVITVLPMALIPFFGVGISGASHLISLDILKQPKE